MAPTPKDPLPSTSSTVNLVDMTKDPPGYPPEESVDAAAYLPEDDVFVDNSLAWGWRGFKPSWLQWLNSPKWFLFCLCIFSFLQGMAVNTFISMSFPSLEKQFALSSQASGFIASSNDITALILVVFVSFFGSYGHKTKWLGGGALLTGIGALVFALPQLLAPKHDPTGVKIGGSPFCRRNATTASPELDCQTSSAHASNLYYAIFILSQLMSGAGTTPLHTLGPAYIDENVPPGMVGFYLAAFYLSVFLGPGLGSVIGGQLLTIYVDITTPPDTSITPTHPHWIGAWWLGPLSCGFLIMICGLVLVGFPRHLPGAYAIRQNAFKSGHLRKQDTNLKGNIRDILPATKKLLTNGTYIFQVIATTCSVLVGFGLGPFIFKVITGRYGASSFEAGIAIAILLIPGAACGLGFGSFVVKKLGIRRSCRRAAKITFLLQLIGIWGSLSFLIPGCEYSNFAGVDVPYLNSSSSTISLDNPCNAGCGCSTSKYSPINSADGVTYFSPCYAGCPAQLPSAKGYTGCTCLPSSINTTTHHNITVLTRGIHKKPCSRKYLVAFTCASFVIISLGFSNAIPSKIVTLRSVPDNQRAYGLGIQFVFMRTIGALPGPVIIGTIIDHTCTLWKTKCGKPANCLNYDYFKLGWIITSYGFPPQSLSLLFFFLSYYFSSDVDPDKTLSKSHAGAEEVTMGNKADKARSLSTLNKEGIINVGLDADDIEINDNVTEM